MSIGIIGGSDGPTSIFLASSAVSPIEQILFSVILSLLLVHEMDAIRAKEWKMIIVLKNMSEEAAYRLFTLIHIPLYVAVIFMLFHGGAVASYLLKIVIDVFLLGHAIIHFGFRKHSDNGFKTWFSKSIIYSMSALALFHLCLLLVL
jgi:hypothetical protein